MEGEGIGEQQLMGTGFFLGGDEKFGELDNGCYATLQK